MLFGIPLGPGRSSDLGPCGGRLRWFWGCFPGSPGGVRGVPQCCLIDSLNRLCGQSRCEPSHGSPEGFDRGLIRPRFIETRRFANLRLVGRAFGRGTLGLVFDSFSVAFEPTPVPNRSKTSPWASTGWRVKWCLPPPSGYGEGFDTEIY